MSRRLSIYSTNIFQVQTRVGNGKYLLRDFRDTHVLDFHWLSILSLADTVCDKDALAIVDFISEAYNRCVPYPVNLPSDKVL